MPSPNRKRQQIESSKWDCRRKLAATAAVTAAEKRRGVVGDRDPQCKWERRVDS